MDPVSGNFGGEIRLGYESDGENVHPVVGGSLSANFANVLKNIKLLSYKKKYYSSTPLILLTPALDASSFLILNVPNSLVLATCGPPHNSLDTSPIK